MEIEEQVAGLQSHWYRTLFAITRTNNHPVGGSGPKKADHIQLRDALAPDSESIDSFFRLVIYGLKKAFAIGYFTGTVYAIVTDGKRANSTQVLAR